MLRYRGRSVPFWLGRFVTLSREGEAITAFTLMLGTGFICGLFVGSFLANGWLVGVLFVAILLIGLFLGAQWTVLAIVSDAWGGDNNPG